MGDLLVYLRELLGISVTNSPRERVYLPIDQVTEEIVPHGHLFQKGIDTSILQRLMEDHIDTELRNVELEVTSGVLSHLIQVFYGILLAIEEETEGVQWLQVVIVREGRGVQDTLGLESLESPP